MQWPRSRIEKDPLPSFNTENGYPGPLDGQEWGLIGDLAEFDLKNRPRCGAFDLGIDSSKNAPKPCPRGI